MERQRIVVALIAAVGLSVALVDRSSAQGPGQGFGNSGGRRFHPGHERWREMSVEDRQRIKSNAARWLQMPPEERRELRMREVMRRQRIRGEAEAALQSSGLQLEAEKRELYERRYMQERRRIERSLRQELEERRARELAPVVEGLKKEFAQPQAFGNPSGAAAVVSPSPKK